MFMRNYLKKFIMYFRLFIANEYGKARIYNKYLGIQFGNGVRITHFPHWGSEPFLIKIGHNVTITRGVNFVTHDGGVGLFRKEFPGINVFGRITVGDNVFIGINAIILPGVIIGNNVIIGAGSIVTKNIPDGSVIAGIPAKIINTTENYKRKILNKAVFINTKGNERRIEIINSIT